MKKVNLSTKIKVKLTPYGTDVFYRYHEKASKEIVENGGRAIDPEMPKINSEGFTVFQLWQFMQIYGDYIGPGMPLVLTDCNLYLNEKDLEKS